MSYIYILRIKYIYIYICLYLHISTDNAIICKQKRTANRPFLLKSQRDFSCKQPPSAEAVFCHYRISVFFMSAEKIVHDRGEDMHNPLYTTVEGSIVKVSKRIKVS